MIEQVWDRKTDIDVIESMHSWSYIQILKELLQ